MAGKNYYTILGIPRDAALEGIRTAFRRLAKRYHPDRAGPGAAERFREIHEAYSVLSDSRARGAYDHSLAVPAPPPPRRASRPPMGPTPIGRPPLGRAATASVPAEPLIARDPPPAPPRRVLRAEVILTPAEADLGGVASLPIPRSCPACNGSGGFGPLACTRCSATGTLPGDRTLQVRLPPMAGHRASYDLVLDETSGLVLHLDVRVADH